MDKETIAVIKAAADDNNVENSEYYQGMQKNLDQLDEMIDIQCSDGNWNYDSYMQGMANGMIFARSCITGVDPVYVEAPETWGCDSTEEHVLESVANEE